MQNGLELILPDTIDEAFQQLVEYQNLLVAWNERVNLVSRNDIPELWAHHILPSVAPLRIIAVKDNSWVMDIGSGGGLPALPLKILRPDLQVLMIDSIRKKTLFLRTAISQLTLKGISVVNDRMENLTARFEYQHKFDIISARAVARIDSLIELGRPFLKPGGSFLLWKGSSDIPELEETALRLNLHWQIHSPPPEWSAISKKFEELRWFSIRIAGASRK